MDIRESPGEAIRYLRHYAIPEIGVAGQEKLKNAKVLCIGAGGLGAPLLSYLVAAGIGTLGIVDDDTIEETNLQRQVLFKQEDIGKLKIDVALERLHQLNPYTTLLAYRHRFGRENGASIINDFDVVVDCSDNHKTRFAVNDVCVAQKKINIYGSVYQFEGQCSVFDSTIGPCYRCLFPSPPPARLIPNCAQSGVVGAIPGIIGSLQAIQALKLICQVGETLVGKLLVFDGLSLECKLLPLEKKAECLSCGNNNNLERTQQIDSEEGTTDDVPELSPLEAKHWIESSRAVQILDVRESFEYELGHIEKSRLTLISGLSNCLPPLTKDSEILIYCHKGARGREAARLYVKNGYTRVFNLRGGIDAWAVEIDPGLIRY